MKQYDTQDGAVVQKTEDYFRRGGTLKHSRKRKKKGHGRLESGRLPYYAKAWTLLYSDTPDKWRKLSGRSTGI